MMLQLNVKLNQIFNKQRTANVQALLERLTNNVNPDPNPKFDYKLPHMSASKLENHLVEFLSQNSQDTV